jgi:hypothetical protein
MPDKLSAHQRLVSVIKPIATKHQKTIDRLKKEERRLKRSGFIWHYLLQSLSTFGGVRGWNGLIGNKENYSKVTYRALSKLSFAERLATLKETMWAAKIRMPDKKAQWLVENFELIKEMGGLKSAKEALLSKPGRDEKIKFLKSFSGIGDKYARNILMDVHHPDFRDSIAIDSRIKRLSETLALNFDSYAEHEQFYLDVAHEAGLTGWDIDRLLFNFMGEVLEGLRKVRDNEVVQSTFVNSIT